MKPVNLRSNGISIIGYIPQPGVDSLEYRDYTENIARMHKDEFEIQLRTGTLPPGLVILPDGMIPGVVRGRGEDQYIERISFTEGIRI